MVGSGGSGSALTTPAREGGGGGGGAQRVSGTQLTGGFGRVEMPQSDAPCKHKRLGRPDNSD